MTGKISRLPSAIRDELHRRLDDGQTEEKILPWLNSLPEVQAVLNESFAGEPINPVNLCNYRKRGFRRWQLRQSATEFLTENPDDAAPQAQFSSGAVIDQLVRWIALRFAAAAETSPGSDDPEIELRQIRDFLADIVSLRRGELISRRIAIEQQRLEAHRQKSHEELQKLFWQWAQRPDIRAKLNPQHDPNTLRQRVVSILDSELLGTRNNGNDYESDPDPDPACCI